MKGNDEVVGLYEIMHDSLVSGIAATDGDTRIVEAVYGQGCVEGHKAMVDNENVPGKVPG